MRALGAAILIGIALAMPAAGASTSDDLGTSLRTACENGDVPGASDLLAQGADVNAPDKSIHATPLICAASRDGDGELIALLLQHGAKPEFSDVLGMNALMWAARIGSVENMTALLKSNVDIDAKDKSGQTALFDTWGSPTALTYLLDHGAAVDVEDNDGVSPLDVAVALGSSEAVAALIAHGANVNAKTHKKETAFTFLSHRKDKSLPTTT